LNVYDIWQLGYSPINLNELYIALEKYPRKDIAKLQKMDLHLVLRKITQGLDLLHIADECIPLHFMQ
jgi:hypothetical protein